MVRLFTIVHQSGYLPFSSEMLHTYSGVDGMLPPLHIEIRGCYLESESLGIIPRSPGLSFLQSIVVFLTYQRGRTEVDT